MWSIQNVRFKIDYESITNNSGIHYDRVHYDFLTVQKVYFQKICNSFSYALCSFITLVGTKFFT